MRSQSPDPSSTLGYPLHPHAFRRTWPQSLRSLAGWASLLVPCAMVLGCGGSDASTEAVPPEPDEPSKEAGDPDTIAWPEADAGPQDASPGVDAGAPAKPPGVGEVCGNGLDDNLDGHIDEECACDEGTTQACFPGDPAHAGEGVCVMGTQVCENSTSGEFAKTQWGACVGAGVASQEACNGVDDDCDGTVDDDATCPSAQKCVAGACVEDCTPVDGGWSDWVPGTCSVACGSGTRTDTRSCTNPPPACGGASCSGESQRTESCGAGTCPVCGTMQKWLECTVSEYVNGVHGDDSSPEACALSCGQMGAACAKYILYDPSAVCVCHSAHGSGPSTGSFAQGNSSGWQIWASECY